jgi:hypothetical protein
MNKYIGKRRWSTAELEAAACKMTYRDGLKQGILDAKRGIDLSRAYRNNPEFIKGYKEGISR